MKQFFLSLFRHGSGQATPGQREQARPSFRPIVERLEDRTVPAIPGNLPLFLRPPPPPPALVNVNVISDDLRFLATDQVVTLRARIRGVGVNGGTVDFIVRDSDGTLIGRVNNVVVRGGVARTPFTLPAGTEPDSYTVKAVFSARPGTSGSKGGSDRETFTVQGTTCADNSFLGTAAAFAVLGGSTVTNTNPTNIEGSVGVAGGSAIEGFPPGLVTDGTIHEGNTAVEQQAQSDVTTAYNVLAGLPVTQDLTGVDLGGQTLTPGVYRFADEAQLTGTLTLDVQGNPQAVFVFQIGSSLTTGSSSSVMLINNLGQDVPNVFWQVGVSATLGSTTSFMGNILANESITLITGATIMCGRALAQTGAVTLDNNVVSRN
jgi:hypothetical protein